MQAAALSAAAIGMSALSSGVGAVGKASADSYQAAEMDRAAQFGELKATQTNAQFTRNMSSTLANMDAVSAAAHRSPASPTGMAVRQQVEGQLTNEKNIKVDSLTDQAEQDEANAKYLRNASSMALLTGGFDMLSSGLKGVSGMPAFSGGTP